MDIDFCRIECIYMYMYLGKVLLVFGKVVNYLLYMVFFIVFWLLGFGIFLVEL